MLLTNLLYIKFDDAHNNWPFESNLNFSLDLFKTTLHPDEFAKLNTGEWSHGVRLLWIK